MIEGAELIKSLAIAVVNIARDRTSALLSWIDLFDLVKRHCPKEHRDYWAGPYPSPSSVTGLLRVAGAEEIPLGWWGGPDGARKVGELRRLIEAHHVEFWEGPDDRWRIVDSAWPALLSSHQIHNRLIKWDGGQRCRFCGMLEPLLDELKPIVELQQHPDMRARALNRSLVHERCKLPFLDAVEQVVRASSLEAAANG